ncbi:MAG TPA: nuclear transport factor 2 family protein [Sphingomicrobium sp.]|jgi:uncharacterized protein (TIGR02246 family)|nr:nuclear transport factor 2 family protein [Sphingomicrobium sp.]
MTITADRVHSMAQRYTEAWNSGQPEAVAAFFSRDGGISINGGELWRGTEGVASMAAGFYSDVPNLRLVCDGVRASGNHAVYLWTFTGTHATTKRELRVSGWEEWDLDDAGLIERSCGNFDVEDYSRQAGL